MQFLFNHPIIMHSPCSFTSFLINLHPISMTVHLFCASYLFHLYSLPPQNNIVTTHSQHNLRSLLSFICNMLLPIIQTTPFFNFFPVRARTTFFLITTVIHKHYTVRCIHCTVPRTRRTIGARVLLLLTLLFNSN